MGIDADGTPPTAAAFWAKHDQPISDAIKEADLYGWAEVAEPISRIMRSIERLSLVPVPPRTGEPAVSVLTPKLPKDAAARSLSVKYGTGVFPLHTDGAHLEHVPDFVLLEATTTGEGVPTMIHELEVQDMRKELGDALTHGMFLVENGPGSFYAPAFRGGFRYDPGCMKPADDRAERVADYFEQLAVTATAHHWEKPGKTLVIANRFALHGRGDATQSTQRELSRVMLRKVGK